MEENTNNYYNYRATDGSSFRACAALEDNPQRTCSSPSQNCYCVSSAQGTLLSGGSTGLPPDSPSSCDGNGTLTYGLVGYWKLNGNTTDSSGQGNNGSGQGSGPNHWSSDVPQPSSISSGNFNGTNDYISITDPANGSLDLGDRNFTLSVWTKQSAGVANGGIISKGSGFQNTTPGYTIYLSSGGNIAFWVTNTAGVHANLYSNTANLKDGTWKHIVVTRSSNTVTIYLNGNKDKESSTVFDEFLWGSNTSIDTGSNFLIGNASTGYLNGLADDIRIYSRSLSQPEIQLLTNSCIP